MSALKQIALALASPDAVSFSAAFISARRSWFHSSMRSWPLTTASPFLTGRLAMMPPMPGDSRALRQAVTVPARVLETVFSTVPFSAARMRTTTGSGRVAR
jgi:hypothetical protein